MRIRTNRWPLLGSLALALGLSAACDDSGGDATPTPSGDALNYPEWYTPTDTGGGPIGPQPNENCAYDPAKRGRGLGDHIADFSARDHADKLFNLHTVCGTSKAVWIILAAQW